MKQETIDTLFQRYEQMNGQLKRPLVYRVGIDAGFFAEYTAMLNAMLYAMDHAWQFRLYGDRANFGYASGWNDYFQSFCPADHRSFHARWNLYPVAPWRLWRALPKAQRKSQLAWRMKLYARHAVGRLVSLAQYKSYVCLNHNVHFQPQSHYNNAMLALNGDYLTAFKTVTQLTWRFNERTQSDIDALVQSLPMNADYVGCHLRGGDKITEAALMPPEAYVDLIRQYAPGRDVFVLTDDYRLFRRLGELAPEVRFFTLCRPEETGYVNKDFVSAGAEAKRQSMTRLFASIELLLKGRMFFGSITTGPGIFLLKNLYPKGIAVDCAPEMVKEAVTLPIADRSRIAEQYMKEYLKKN